MTEHVLFVALSMSYHRSISVNSGHFVAGGRSDPPKRPGEVEVVFTAPALPPAGFAAFAVESDPLPMAPAFAVLHQK